MTKKPPKWIRGVLRAGVYGSALVLLLSVVTMLFEDKLIYFPEKYPEGDWDAPARAEVPVEDVFFEASDGVKLHGWYLPAEDAEITILFLHGNAGNITHRFDWMTQLAALPANVFLIDYRGYGKSEGKPTEEGLYRDADAAYRYLTQDRGVPPERIVVYGKSLGSAPACHLASRFECGGLILQSAFTNARDMAREIMSLFPAYKLIRTRFDNEEKIARITSPILIIHARDDNIIPFSLGERLYRAANEPKTFVSFDDGGHNEMELYHGAEIVEAFKGFTDGLSAK
ncbi:MAG: alpha/beta hydrolase [Armatimonadetes bacterium]|nr:alpha/beta hydrolase [Armatimonadota bacterium]